MRGSYLKNLQTQWISVVAHRCFRELDVERKSHIRDEQIGKVCLKPTIQRLEAGETSRALLQHGKGLRNKQKFRVAELHQRSSKTNAELFNDSHKPFYQLLIKHHGLLSWDTPFFFLINIKAKFSGLQHQMWFVLCDFKKTGTCPQLMLCFLVKPCKSLITTMLTVPENPSWVTGLLNGIWLKFWIKFILAPLLYFLSY